MSAIPYRNLNSQASFRDTPDTPRQSTKSISHHQLPVESNRDGLLLEVANQALQPDVSADVTPCNLRRAAACGAELKRLLLIERPHIRNRRARLTIEVLVAVADRVIFAIEHLGVRGRFGKLDEASVSGRKGCGIDRS